MSTDSLETSDDSTLVSSPCKKLIARFINVLNDIFEETVVKPTPYENLNVKLVKSYFDPDEKTSDFLFRFIQKTQIEESTLVYALIYFDKVACFDIVTGDNCLIFLFLSLVLALKFNEDFTHKNPVYADLVKISPDYLCDLEVMFLKLISFRVYVSQPILEHFQFRLNKAEANIWSHLDLGWNFKIVNL